MTADEFARRRSFAIISNPYHPHEAAVNYRLPHHGLTLFVGAVNLTDRKYIVGRVNGIQVGAPRQVFIGARWAL